MVRAQQKAFFPDRADSEVGAGEAQRDGVEDKGKLVCG
jgi:hypothetical protein